MTLDEQARDALARLTRGLNEAQARVVSTLDEPMFVAAGAGSGKTFTLTRRIVWALTPGSGEGGAPFLDSLDQALVITFTEKAAGEIKERVRSSLREAQLGEAALAVDSSWISTIHGMCSRILRRHALELGISPGFTVLGEHRCSTMLDQALERALDEALKDPSYAELLDAGYAVRGGGLSGDAPSSIAGMVRALVVRAASMSGGFDALEFPGQPVDVRGAVGDVARSLASFVAAACSGRLTDSKRADLARLQGALGVVEGLVARAPGSLTADDAMAALAPLKPPSGTCWRSGELRERRLEAAGDLEWARAALGLTRSRELVDALLRLARLVERNYAQAKREAGGLDNDDLLRLALDALRDHPDIARRYGSQFRLVMVDEFQDTNAQQVDMISRLSGPGARHLTTVGDAQQSIYRFRGADVSVFERRGEQVGEGGRVTMADNFRSHDDVLRFVARVCADTAPGAHDGLIRGFMDLACARGSARHPFVPGGAPRVYVELASLSGAGNRSVPNQAEQVASRLAALRDAGQDVGGMALLLGRMRPADEYVAAMRAHGLDCVIAGGSTFSSAPEVRCVAALLHVLANPRDTSLGTFPALASEMFGLDADDLVALASKEQVARERDTGQLVPTGVPARRSLDAGITGGTLELFGGMEPSARLSRAHATLARAWEAMGAQPVADVVARAVRESGWLSRLERDGACGRARAANVLAAVRHVRELTEEMGLGPARAAWEFDHWLEVSKEGPASLQGAGAGAGAVRVMTVHASKGLQFPVVAVAELEPRAPRADTLAMVTSGDRVLCSLRPAKFSLPDDDEAPAEPGECRDVLDWRRLLESREVEGTYDEAARLLYVALTRAEEALVLCLGVKATRSGELAPRFTADVVGHLMGALPPAGESRLAFGGSASALVRHVSYVWPQGGEPSADSGGTLDDAALAARLVPGGASHDAEGSCEFELFESPGPSPAALGSWSPREGIWSYSSAARAGALGPVAAEGPAGREGAGDCGDAIALGSAFHELAQVAVECRAMPDDERVGLVARAWGLTRAQRERLDDALARWGSSDLRREALGHAVVRAEVPFLIEAPGSLGSHLEGAIDLLASDGVPGRGVASPAALVVDYKTGDLSLDLGQIREAHLPQASLYAGVLQRLGYGAVECAFVCVERDGGDGQPLVARYRFGAGQACPALP